MNKTKPNIEGKGITNSSGAVMGVIGKKWPIRRLILTLSVILIAIVTLGVISYVVMQNDKSKVDETPKISSRDIRAKTLIALKPTSQFDYQRAEALLNELAIKEPAVKEDLFYNTQLFYMCNINSNKACLKLTAKKIVELSPDQQGYDDQLPKELLPLVKKYAESEKK